MDAPIRVRFAPSPTGYLHIGGARTALFNWLFARHHGGKFILRIEDTDTQRNSQEAIDVILRGLSWLGLDWDEGPTTGDTACPSRGDRGPYFQSRRGEIYARRIQELRDKGLAYDRDGAVFFRMSREAITIPDLIIGDVLRPLTDREEADPDWVLVRSDGNPVFHLVNVVDDIAMQVTHVIRGEDHLSNTSKHVRLYEGFGVPPPVFAHIPLILKQNGPGKMSKRDQGALIEEYQRRGYLPEALVNFLCLLGWNPGDDREKLPLAEIVRLFDLPGVNQSNARFDDRKLAHMNQTYLLELPADDFLARAREQYGRAGEAGAPALAAAADYFRAVVLLCQPKLKGLEELPAYAAHFFTEDFPIDAKVREKVLAKGDPWARLDEVLAALPGLDFGSDLALEEGIKALATRGGLGFGDYQSVVRLAVSGTNVGPSLTGMMRVLGRERVQARLERLRATR